MNEGSTVIAADRTVAADEEMYGRAARFVRRSRDCFWNCKRFYSPTPEQAMWRLLDHVARIGALGKRLLSDEQRQAARKAVFQMVQDLQEIELDNTVSSHPVETQAGGAEQVHRIGEIAASGMGQRFRAADWTDDTALQRVPLSQDHDVPVSYRDPAEQLSRYRMRGSEGLRTILPPKQDAQFQLIENPQIMDRMRAHERRLGLDRQR
jgi:hypothetical protein